MITKALEIDGWMTPVELEWLANIAKKCKVIVEFGSYQGRSTRALADNCSGVIYAIDPWNGADYGGTAYHDYDVDFFHKNLEDHIANKKVIPIKDYSHNFSPYINVDLVFIDGDHRYMAVLSDIAMARKLTSEGGIIAGHDYGARGCDGVKIAVDNSFSGVQLADTIWWVRV